MSLTVRNSLGLAVLLAISLVAGALPASSNEGLVLWNKLGSEDEVLNSEFGPGLVPYGESVFDPGVFGGCLGLGGGPYSVTQRVYNVALENVGDHINMEAGTVEVWHLQTTDPVPYSNNPYRIFDGSFGLSGECIGFMINGEWSPPAIAFYFGSSCGGTGALIHAPFTGYNGAWVHVAAVWDRAGIDGTAETMQIYVDGEKVASGTENGWAGSIGGHADIGGGNDNNIAGKFFLDNLLVWDHARTEFTFGEEPGPADADDDGIDDGDDVCEGTVIPESVPTKQLGVNRWALVDDDGVFDTESPPGGGHGPGLEFTLEDTGGCSCEQIIELLALGHGHTKFGCSNGAMLEWRAMVGDFNVTDPDVTTEGGGGFSQLGEGNPGSEGQATASTAVPDNTPRRHALRTAARSGVDRERSRSNVERHLAIVVDRRGSAKLQAHSRYALLSALGGGYPADLRLEILRGLGSDVDPSLRPLLERHARDLIEELESKGEHDLATRARSRLTGR